MVGTIRSYTKETILRIANSNLMRELHFNKSIVEILPVTVSVYSDNDKCSHESRLNVLDYECRFRLSSFILSLLK